MRVLLASLLALLPLVPVAAQVRVEGELFVADRGNQMNGSGGAIRRYGNAGAFLGNLPNAGSGALRSVELDEAGNVYAARGNQVLRWSANGFVPDATPFATGTRAQCVAVHPQTQDVWIGWGIDASNALIEHRDATGMLLDTVISPLLEQPRAMVFSEDGDRLFVANSEGNDVLVVDLIASPPTVAVHSALGAFGTAGFAPIGIARDPAFGTDDLYVVGDFLVATDVLRVTGPTGGTTVASAISYAGAAATVVPGGAWVDSWGSICIAGRSSNGGTPAVRFFRLDGQPNTVPPIVTGGLVNPIDVAYRMETFDVTITNGPGNDVFTDANGSAAVVVGPGVQPHLRIDVDAPKYPNHAYIVVFSLLTDGDCMLGDAVRPNGEGLPFSPLDGRRFPIEANGVFDASLQMLTEAIAIGGMPAFMLDPLVCPTSVAGDSLFLYGVTDASGHGQARLTFPTFPAACFPDGFEFYLGFAAAVLDNTTGPLGIALMSGAAECLHVFHFP